MKIQSVCISCGELKAEYWSTCPRCGVIPRSGRELALSYSLSTVYERGGELSSRSMQELREIGADIRLGKPFTLDDEALREAEAEVSTHAVARRQLSGVGFTIVLLKGFWPILLIATLIGVVLARR